jgi:hypothetical protein
MIKVYKENIIEGLKQLSDREFQRIAWFENDQGLSSSFIDDVNGVFDETGLDYAFNKDKCVFGAEADNALKDLDKDTKAIDELNQSDSEIFYSSEMQIIREKAAIALALVLASDGSESTVEIIEE